jgi:hypothetical protein
MPSKFIIDVARRPERRVAEPSTQDIVNALNKAKLPHPKMIQPYVRLTARVPFVDQKGWLDFPAGWNVSLINDNAVWRPDVPPRHTTYGQAPDMQVVVQGLPVGEIYFLAIAAHTQPTLGAQAPGFTFYGGGFFSPAWQGSADAKGGYQVVVMPFEADALVVPIGIAVSGMTIWRFYSATVYSKP